MRRFAIFALLFFAAGEARAHVIPDPRVIVVVTGPKSLELRVNDMGQPGDDSANTRREFDGDHDGKLDDSEQANLAGFLVARALEHLTVTQAGKKLELHEVSRTLHGIDRGVESSDSVSIDVILRASPAPAKDGRIEVVIEDWRADGHAVRAAVMAQDTQLLSTSLGEIEDGSGVATGIALVRGQSEALSWRGIP